MLVKEELEQLLELQNIDDQLRELENSKVYLPDMISNIEKELQNWKEKYEKGVADYEESTREKKRLELEIEVFNSELKNFQQQMKVIKTNKEYDALTAQISSVKEKINEYEEKLLEIMEQLDTLEEETKENKKRYEELKNSNKEVLAGLQQRIESIDTKMKMKRDERKVIESRITRRILSHYERISSGKGGMAVVTVRRHSCGGCFKQLSPKMMQEIKRGERIITCDSCGRILIWAGDESQ